MSGLKTMNVHKGHRSRLREKVKAGGLATFSQHEVLELLLTFAIPRRDVNPLAHALIREFGSLHNVHRSVAGSAGRW